MKKFFIATMTLILTLAFSVNIFADQAAYVSEKQAKKAVKLLKKKERIMHLCEPCSDQTRKVAEIETVEAVKTGYKDFWEVKINGKGVDLAYIFYEHKKGKWKNVAKKLDIPVEGVSKEIKD
jgi:hypothetical protein